MEVKGFTIIEETYKDNKYYALYIVINQEKYLIGTLRGKDFKYIKSVRGGR